MVKIQLENNTAQYWCDGVTLYSMKEQGITQPVSLVSWSLSSLATACTARLYSASMLQLPHTGSPALGNLECMDRV